MAIGRKRKFTQTFKRNSRPGGGFKKRRFSRRRGRKSTAITSKSGVGSSFGFKSRKSSKRTWNRMLWNSTLQKTHYRSYGSGSYVMQNPSVTADVNVSRIDAMYNGTAEFYFATGGAQTNDVSIAVPTFTGDVILRGGLLGLKVCNDTVVSVPVEVNIYLVMTSDNPVTAVFPFTTSIGWDPTVIPDWNERVGRILFRKKILLENEAMAEVNYRVPIRKIDRSSWSSGKRKYYWIVSRTSGQASATDHFVSVVAYFNCSFSSDAT